MSSRRQSKGEEAAAQAAPLTLAFHKLTPKITFGSTNFSPRRFERLFLFLENLGISSKSGAMRHVNVSFDDGYQHLCEFLPPLMERLSFRPTIFVPTDLIGRPNSWDYSCRLAPDPHMDETSIRELADLGVRFGSHGKSHCDLTSCDPERIKSELADSRKRLQNLIGRPVDEISYPFGRTNPRVLEAAAGAGFSRGYTMDFPTPEDLPLSIGRIAVYGFDTHLTVYHKLTGGRLYRLERFKAHITNRLSGGTVLLNKLRGHQ